MTVTATLTNFGDGRALPARDQFGRHVVVPKSCLMAVAPHIPWEPGLTVTGTVTDANQRGKLTMVRVTSVTPAARETFPATVIHPVSAGSRYTHLDSKHGPSSVFAHANVPGFRRLTMLRVGATVQVSAFRNADQKWTALQIDATTTAPADNQAPLILTVMYEPLEDRLEVTYSHPVHDDRAAFVAFPGLEPQARADFAAWLSQWTAWTRTTEELAAMTPEARAARLAQFGPEERATFEALLEQGQEGSR